MNFYRNLPQCEFWENSLTQTSRIPLLRPQGRSCYMQLFLRILYRASYLSQSHAKSSIAHTGTMWRKSAVPYSPSHTLSETHFFFSFANVSTNNVCPIPALKQSATDEINGFPGKPYFMSYKSNVSLYPFSLSVLNSGSKLGSKKT